MKTKFSRFTKQQLMNKINALNDFFKHHHESHYLFLKKKKESIKLTMALQKLNESPHKYIAITNE